ncbi:MAG: anthranilate synthase component I family protein [Myxococcales bacterium]|nr:anthranilate synthase component I family protein [Myxococcales bacterium]
MRRPGFVWLDGQGDAGEEGRWSYFASDPIETLEAPSTHADPLSMLRHIDHHPGFWIGYVAYDAAWAASYRTGKIHHRNPHTPALWFARYPGVFSWDHKRRMGWCLGSPCDLTAKRPKHPLGLSSPMSRSISVDSGLQHERGITEALKRIRAGDIYQVNLARRWRARYSGDPLALYLALRAKSAVPFGCYMDAGTVSILSQSMECFLDWRGPGGALKTQPIKGTTALKSDPNDSAAALRSDGKELAEHTMIVDLMRNDLGRIAVPHSVHVVNPYAIKPFGHLCHMMSTVVCRTPSETTLESIFRATFPPGSISGTPKHAAVSLIETLEPAARGIYSGALGIVFPDKQATFAVGIRTAVIDGEVAEYWAGGGIVAESDPKKELAETTLKARIFTEALARLGKRASRNSRMPTYYSRRDRAVTRQ